MNIHVRLFCNRVKMYVLQEIKCLLYLAFYFLQAAPHFVEVKSVICLNLQLLRYLQRFSPAFYVHILLALC